MKDPIKNVFDWQKYEFHLEYWDWLEDDPFVLSKYSSHQLSWVFLIYIRFEHANKNFKHKNKILIYKKKLFCFKKSTSFSDSHKLPCIALPYLYFLR